jgi:hypothetical protein
MIYFVYFGSIVGDFVYQKPTKTCFFMFAPIAQMAETLANFIHRASPKISSVTQHHHNLEQPQPQHLPLRRPELHQQPLRLRVTSL